LSRRLERLEAASSARLHTALSEEINLLEEGRVESRLGKEEGGRRGDISKEQDLFQWAELHWDLRLEEDCRAGTELEEALREKERLHACAGKGRVG
jgi:hypothetical protein